MPPGAKVNVAKSAEEGRPFPLTANTPRAGHPVYRLEPSFGGTPPTDCGAAWYQEGERLMRGHATLSESYWQG
eukprot:12778839-Alexandrium_andersonii.AAC.1